MKKSLIIKFALLFFAFIFVNSTLADSSIKTAKSDISFLLVQTASKGSLVAIPGKPTTYILTLKPVRPYVTYFSSRPSRIAKLMPIEEFVSNWDAGINSFKKTPPNADVSGVLVKDLLIKKSTNFAVELLNVKYDAKNNSITYTVHLLQADKTLSNYNKFDYIALFIDDFSGCPSCWNG